MNKEINRSKQPDSAACIAAQFEACREKRLALRVIEGVFLCNFEGGCSQKRVSHNTDAFCRAAVLGEGRMQVSKR